MMSRSKPPRILVIRRQYLGDLALLGPVFTNLRHHYPQSHIALLVNEKYSDVQKNNPDLNEILSIPGLPCESKVAYVLHWIQLLQKLRGRFDIVYDFARNSRSILLMKWSGARHRVSFAIEDEPHPRERYYNILANWTQADERTLHTIDFTLKLLEADGIPIVTRQVKLYVPDSDALEAQQCLRAALKDEQNIPPKSTFVLVHPGARLSTRCWPPENFAAVCDALQNQSQATVLLLAGSGEEAKVRAVQVAMHTRVRILKAPSTVPKLAALLQAADLFICNDSGPMHVAAAVGTPVVALFGAQPTTLWHPAGENNTVLQPSLPCADRCLFPGICQPPNTYKMRCIQRITVEEVIDAALPRVRSKQNFDNEVCQ
ncbi:MAG: glycosyltransferase family 9 protein [Abditibacteriaceae bacterium]